MAQPHLSKEELRHDAFRDTMFEGIDYLQKHLKMVIGGTAIVMVLVAAGIGYYTWQQSVAQEESADFNAAEKVLAQTNLSKDERIKQTDTAMSAFLKAHPGSRLAVDAHVYIGRLAFEQKDYAKAEAAYQAALSDSHVQPVQRAIVLLSLARIRIAQGKPADAQVFLDQVTDKRFEDAKAYVQGTANLAAGKAAEAKKQFQLAATAQPQSPVTGWAKDALDFLP